MTAPSALARLVDFLRAEGQGSVLALGWATVELERAAIELEAALNAAVGSSATAFVDAPESVVLGARCRVAAGALAGGLGVVLLEPSTEGRLAASLARFGEGPIATWRSGPDGPQRNLTAVGAGPLGPERLELGGPKQGPYRLVVSRPGTIAP